MSQGNSILEKEQPVKRPRDSARCDHGTGGRLVCWEWEKMGSEGVRGQTTGPVGLNKGFGFYLKHACGHTWVRYAIA